jgi:hypothetical protein
MFAKKERKHFRWQTENHNRDSKKLNWAAKGDHTPERGVAKQNIFTRRQESASERKTFFTSLQLSSALCSSVPCITVSSRSILFEHQQPESRQSGDKPLYAISS